MNVRNIVIALVLLLPLLTSGAVLSAAPADTVLLDTGYAQMYNLDFSGAHRNFTAWEQAHPADPIGFASNAAAFRFYELDRRPILESELFTDNQKFGDLKKLTPDPNLKAAFEKELAKADQLADQALARSSTDRDALFSRILINGLRGDYAALIEKRNIAGLNYMKSARLVAEKLVAMEPGYYDAYFAVGVENYLLGQSAAPVRWILRMVGAETDKDAGITNIRITAEKGHHLAPFAQLLLAVVALRSNDLDTARIILAGLARQFPQNPLYLKELAHIQPQMAPNPKPRQ